MVTNPPVLCRIVPCVDEKGIVKFAVVESYVIPVSVEATLLVLSSVYFEQDNKTGLTSCKQSKETIEVADCFKNCLREQ